MTDAELAILTILSEGASSDRELSLTIEARGLRKWTAIGNSSMSYVLDKLLRQGLIDLISEDTHQRNVRISQAGTGVLQTSIADLLSNVHTYDKTFELGLANLHVLRTSQIRDALLSREQDLTSHLSWLREEKAQGDKPFQIEALFAHSIAMINAELAWLRTFREVWEKQAPAEPEIVLEPQLIARSKQVVLPQDPDSFHKQITQEGQELSDKHATPPGISTSIKRPKTPQAGEP